MYDKYEVRIQSDLKKYKDETIPKLLDSYKKYLLDNLSNNVNKIKQDFLYKLREQFYMSKTHFTAAKQYTDTDNNSYEIPSIEFNEGPIHLRTTPIMITHSRGLFGALTSKANVHKTGVKARAEPPMQSYNINNYAITEMLEVFKSFKNENVQEESQGGGTRRLRKKNRKGSLKRRARHSPGL